MLEKDFNQKAFTYIEPGPVVLVTTNDGHKNNICTISWMMVMDFAPHCHVAISTGEWNHSFEIMMKNKECCICIPSADLAEQVVKIGVVSGIEKDKFSECNLTPQNAEQVQAPLIQECIAGLECRVVDYIEKYGLVIMRSEQLWVNKEKEFAPMLHANGDGTFRVDSEKVINMREHMKKWVPNGAERFCL